MPYAIVKKSNGRYKVVGPSGVKAKDTSKQKAEKQVRYLNMIEHGGRPRKK